MDGQVSPTKTKQQELVITRTFNAPRLLIWKALTYAEWVKKWWGPREFTAPVIQIDLKVGGKYLYCMRSPDGKDYWNTGVYREIDYPQKLLVTDSFADKKGNVVPPTYYGMSPGFPNETVVSITLEDLGSKTKLTLSGAAPPSDKDRKDEETRWNQSFDKMADWLEKSKTEVQSQFESGEKPPGGMSYHSG
jgi:uncharacterized protein YndB with AHSA1/START domain